jgi:hypothetical protein
VKSSSTLSPDECRSRHTIRGAQPVLLFLRRGIAGLPGTRQAAGGALPGNSEDAF